MIGVFKHKYPQRFLDKLAKEWGFEWTKVVFKTIHKDDVKVRPMNPPTGELFYMEVNYKK